MAGKETDFLDSMMQTAPVEHDESDAPEVTKPEATGEPEQAETGAEAPAVAATPEAVPPTAETAKPEPKTVPLAALHDERNKRQALERQLAELREMQPPQVTEFYQDPERHIADVVGRVQQTMQGQVYAALEYAAKQTYPDYDDMMNVVMEYAQTNPAAAADVMASPNPAVAAYQLGKKLTEYREMQDPAAYRAKIEAELRAKLEAEVAAKVKAQQDAANAEAAKASAIPPDLSTSASASVKTPVRDNNVFSQLFHTN